MGLTVKELLQTEMLKDAKVTAGKAGLDNEIKGVTIIEAPDIVKFIDGGEVLLTGLYAFKFCSVEVFEGYLLEFTKKEISALVLKRGRDVEYADNKISLLTAFAEDHDIPLIEVPFAIAFRNIMRLIMERLFSEEVTRLKYFKTTHDNFTALIFSLNSSDKRVEKMLDVLGKLIRNPVAVFNYNNVCIATANPKIDTINICDDAEVCEPGFYSNYTYLKQKVSVHEEGKIYNQYLVLFEVPVSIKLYLVITEINPEIDTMDYIAIENAITALRQEFFRIYTINELEKKFQNDILFNILNKKINTKQELQKSISLLEMPLNGFYRVMVLGTEIESNYIDKPDSDVLYMDILNDAVSHVFRRAKICVDFDKLIILEEQAQCEKEEEYRNEVKEAILKIQKQLSRYKKYLRVKAGVSKIIEGIANISAGFREANDALMFVDMAGDISGEGSQEIMFFSDLGILKFLCQLNEPEQFREYIPNSLRKLYDYKKPQREDMLITLKAYLNHNHNLAETARVLFIHYKTAAYRIEKIAKLTGMDFNNPNEMLSVRIGLVACKMLEKFENKNS